MQGQIYLGGEDFLKGVQRRVSSKPIKGIGRSHLQPLRPGAEAIEAAVAKVYRLPRDQLLNRSNGEAYKAAVYFLRRAANLPLAVVAERAGVSPGRVSQIQSEIERGGLPKSLKSLANYNKVKA